jgi:hypothetical protein
LYPFGHVNYYRTAVLRLVNHNRSLYHCLPGLGDTMIRLPGGQQTL